MAREKKVEREEVEEEEAPIHGDVLETILSHVHLVDLVPPFHVSKPWKRAVLSSLRHLNPIKPWLIIHTRSSRHPSATTVHAYDPRSFVWVEIELAPIKYVSDLRSAHSTLLYMQSPFKFAFSFDPLHVTWHHAEAPVAWRNDPIVALVGHRVVVAGTTCDIGEDPLPMEIYDLRIGTWDTCKSFPAILIDAAASTCLSITVDEHRMYVTEKSSGMMYSFDPSTKTWRGPYDLRLGAKVFSSVIGFVNGRMVVLGVIGDSENVKSVKLWEVKSEMSEVSEMGEMPKELVGKLKGDSPRITSIGMTSTGDFVYLHNPLDPGVLVLCQVENGECKWGCVRNMVANDASRMQRSVFTCSTVGLEDLHNALRSGNRRFTVHERHGKSIVRKLTINNG